MSPTASRIGALAATGMLHAGAALAQPGVFVTAQGVTVETPAVETLDCDALRRVLDAIDATGYRGTDPMPTDGADMALRDYENRVSARYYTACVHAEAEAAPAQDAFVRGYGR
jgi:hypothetical protein